MLNQKALIHNKFEFEVRDSITGKLKQTAVSYNIILNQCLTRLVTCSSKFGYMHIGTGTGTLDITRTSLFAFLGYKSCSMVDSSYAYPTSWYRRKIELAPSEYVGSTITEVGLAYGTGSSTLCTHSLLQDSEGNPIAIQKTDVDIVTIFSTVYATIGNYGIDDWILPTAANNAVLKGILTDTYTAPTVYLGQWGSEASDRFTNADILSYVFSQTSNDGRFNMSAGGKAFSFTSDTANNKWIFPVQRWDYNVNNPFTVGSIGSPGYGCIRLPNSSVFPTLSLADIAIGSGDGTIKKFDVKVPWIVPNSESIYIDSVLIPSTDYTIDYKSGSSGAIYPYMKDNPLLGYTFTSEAYGFTEYDGDCFAMQGVPGKAIYANGTFSVILHYTNPITASRIFLAPYISSGFCYAYISSDGTTWTQVGGRTSGSGDLVLDDAVTSSWWKIRPYCQQAYPKFIKLYPYYNSKGLVFNTPPAAGKAITMNCQIDRPMKNENWVLDFGFSVQFSRG